MNAFWARFEHEFYVCTSLKPFSFRNKIVNIGRYFSQTSDKMSEILKFDSSGIIFSEEYIQIDFFYTFAILLSKKRNSWRLNFFYCKKPNLKKAKVTVVALLITKGEFLVLVNV